MKATHRSYALATGVIFLSTVATVAISQEIPTLPTIPVRAEAPTTSGGSVVCYGAACEQVINLLQTAPFYSPEQPLARDPSKPVDKEQFCQALENRRPSGCSSSNPPSTPAFDPQWQANGCGTGARSEWLYSLALGQFFGDNYTGNLDAPYPGVSFIQACKAHDRCWGVGGSRIVCDENFLTNMRNQCSAGAGAGVGACNGIASAYHSAVSSTTASDQNYAAAVDAHTCAAWTFDMRNNSCPE